MITHFTPFSALAGGALIGLSAALLLWLNGRVAGISGIVAGLLPPAAGRIGWRVAFLLGLLIGGGLYALWLGHVPPVRLDTGTPLLVLGGLLVGFGTRLGGGCTSGHGVCGVSRLSGRSIVATVVFMVSAGAVVFLLRHVLA